MLKLKLQYLGHLMQRSDLSEKILMLIKIEGRMRREKQGMKCMGGITASMDMSLSKLPGIIKVRKAWNAACSPWGSKELDIADRLNSNRERLACPEAATGLSGRGELISVCRKECFRRRERQRPQTRLSLLGLRTEKLGLREQEDVKGIWWHAKYLRAYKPEYRIRLLIQCSGKQFKF